MSVRTVLRVLAVAGGGLAAACDASRAPPPTVPIASGPAVVAPSATAAQAVASAATAEVDAQPRPAASNPYPVGMTCAEANAVAREGRTLPVRAAWTPVSSAAARVRTIVPPSVFNVAEDASGLTLTSSVHAQGLGPDGSPIPFAIRIRRVARSIDELLADTSRSGPLGGRYVEGAFPKRTENSFVASADEDARVGFASAMTIAGKPAYVLVTGGHGYNTDLTLVRVGERDTLVVQADWNSSIMMGQPECWQRQVIAGVVEGLGVR